MRAIDKANGYSYGDVEERSLQSLMSCAVAAEFDYEKIAKIQDKYISNETTIEDESKIDDAMEAT